MSIQHNGDSSDSREPADVAFVLEQTLGHITHSANLRRLLADADDQLNSTFLPIAFEPGRARWVPGWNNWTIRSGVRARRAVATLRRSSSIDAMFVHTLVPATFLRHTMRRIPTVVSLDATPLQYDELGQFYGHNSAPAPVERLKQALHRSTFARAARLVAWSSWARDGLVEQYGVDPARIDVIPPGVDIDLWEVGATRDDGPLQVLFVGGDLDRKGGDLLIDAAARLRADSTVPDFELHLVTNARVEPRRGMTVHTGLTPNSPALRQRFLEADVFCLPTFGDCLPLVLAEAGASGLPLISTTVGGIAEIVKPGVSGELIAPGDGAGLTEALRLLLVDSEIRQTYAIAAREIVERDHNARLNASRLVGVIQAVIDEDERSRAQSGR